MENNFSDKEMRDKLNSIEFPFEPKAWEQMEAMLDKKKKRRGFFWWWTGGIAAALLLGIAGYEVNRQQTTDNRQQTGQQSTVSGLQSSVDKNSAQPAENRESGNYNGNKQTNDNRKQATEQQSQISKPQFSSNKTALPIGSTGNPVARSTNTVINTRHRTSGIGHSATSKRLTINHNNLITARGKMSGSNIEESPTQAFNYQQPLPYNSQPATSNRQPTTEKLSIAEMAADKLTATELSDNMMKINGEEEVVLQKTKKKVFNYSLGLVANLTGTTLGKQNEGNYYNNRSAASYFFYSEPSYAVGLRQEFMFLKRFAITNSFMFAQTSFKVYNPQTVSFSVSPIDYTSHITELELPIGLKIYPVSKKNVRFYIEAGIINHFKLSETFTYSVLDRDTPVNNNLALPVYPAATNFGGGIGHTYNAVLSSAYGPSSSTSDFSINKANRYYASFYSNIGAEFILKKHFVLFAESLFYVSLEKIGVQNLRKYNLGLSTGFRYEF
jgi:hypothetical protein